MDGLKLTMNKLVESHKRGETGGNGQYQDGTWAESLLSDATRRVIFKITDIWQRNQAQTL